VFSVFGDQIPGDWVIAFVGGLAVVGVFCLFGLAAGLFRFGGTEERRTVLACPMAPWWRTGTARFPM